MRPSSLLTALLASVGVASAISADVLDKFTNAAHLKTRLIEKAKARSAAASSETVGRMANSPYLNNVTEKFVVNGTGLPDIPFDIGESYAGLLPISENHNETRELFFWFFPSQNPAASKEITIWFTGGPGCSGLIGVLQENGPVLWQPGTYLPTRNTYSWSNLTNMLYLEQPAGTGFTQGTPDIVDENGVAKEFIGFYKNFERAFNVKGRDIYITGESYAGLYCPYVSDAMLTDDFNVKGVMIYDPVIGDPGVQLEVTQTAFANYWSNTLSLNSTFIKQMNDLAESCGYTSYMEKYLTFPPPGPFEPVPNSDRSECGVLFSIVLAAEIVNPCFDIHHILSTCPFSWDALGDISFGHNPPSAKVYFARPDVQKAINAPITPGWAECVNTVFSGPDGKNQGDQSDTPALNGVIQRVTEKTNNFIIGNGNLDILIASNGTLMAIQNMTWHGQQGLQHAPNKEFLVPAHDEPRLDTLSGSGVVGSWGTERGLTFFTVELAGHQLPQWHAGAGFRSLEVLLGRVKDFGSTDGFSTQAGGSGNKTGGAGAMRML